jgi:hypothetical protein
MSPADQYRKLASELKSKASAERNQGFAAELKALARSYLRLAEQAEQNGETDLWLEFGAGPALNG